MRFLLTIGIIFLVHFVSAQTDPTVYRKERIKYFEFEPFERSFTGVEGSMDSLINKPGSQWNISDSLLFAVNLAKLGNPGRAYKVLKKMPLKEVENESIPHLTMIYQLIGRFDLAKKWMERYKPNNPEEESAKKIWLNMIRVREDVKEVRTNLKYETIMEMDDRSQYSSSEKESDMFKKEVNPLNGAEIVLRFHVDLRGQFRSGSG
ncbi:MAG: hypothetical protein R2799_03225 [Crocinitomicaceae bacterium]